MSYHWDYSFRTITYQVTLFIEKFKKLYYNILTERDKEDLKMFDDFDTMIQSDELGCKYDDYYWEDDLLYCWVDYDGQEDI